jgi:hypothetical protein
MVRAFRSRTMPKDSPWEGLAIHPLGALAVAVALTVALAVVRIPPQNLDND